LRQDRVPIAFKPNLQLHHDDRERIILNRTRSPLSAAQTERFGRLDKGCLLEANILRGSPRKHTFNGAAAGPEEFTKFLEVDGFGHVIEE
jgi:hypothetical protein